MARLQDRDPPQGRRRAHRGLGPFLASVSHELRTPLTSVLGHLELLIEDVDDAELARRLQVVHRNAVRLRHLVSDLLESAGQRDGVQLSRTPCDVADIVRDAVASVSGAAARQGLELVVDLPPTARAVVDPDRLRQVVDNLVSNAVKYTDPGGAVTVRPAAGDGLRLVVADTGIGIPSDELDQVFEPFYRSDEAARRVTPGVGLGLAISRAIVTAHGGTLEVASEPGRGSELVVSLP